MIGRGQIVEAATRQAFSLVASTADRLHGTDSDGRTTTLFRVAHTDVTGASLFLLRAFRFFYERFSELLFFGQHILKFNSLQQVVLDNVVVRY